VIDVVGFLQGLKEIGYTGPVTPEPFSQRLRRMPAEDAIRETAEALLGVWQKAGV
jgi:sugar phosphate isomerase/epimerase